MRGKSRIDNRSGPSGFNHLVFETLRRTQKHVLLVQAQVDDAAIAAVRDGKPIADATPEASGQFAPKAMRHRGK
jgi:hypothetical protein